jgi:hypothetical protein
MFRHGFNPDRRGRKPSFCLPVTICPPHRDFFAVQHLRMWRDWLNSMQYENVAYFLCMDRK